MAIKVTKIHVWAAEIHDQPGGLSSVLGPLAEAGANLECVVARRNAARPGTGSVFATPLKGRKVLAAAAAAGFRETERITTLKIEGPNVGGLGAKIAAAIGAAGVSLRGCSAAVIGNKFVCYIGFDGEEDASRAAAAIKNMGKKKAPSCCACGH
ncbi:MAG: amino acid-binding protein [Verrucomicrobia bacterium]|nr:amino acid-binding protein [Verrucomicrobiota bacterium]